MINQERQGGNTMTKTYIREEIKDNNIFDDILCCHTSSFQKFEETDTPVNDVEEKSTEQTTIS